MGRVTRGNIECSITILKMQENSFRYKWGGFIFCFFYEAQSDGAGRADIMDRGRKEKRQVYSELFGLLIELIEVERRT
jgi:hypothetical protein